MIIAAVKSRAKADGTRYFPPAISTLAVHWATRVPLGGRGNTVNGHHSVNSSSLFCFGLFFLSFPSHQACLCLKPSSKSGVLWTHITTAGDSSPTGASYGGFHCASPPARLGRSCIIHHQQKALLQVIWKSSISWEGIETKESWYQLALRKEQNCIVKFFPGPGYYPSR